MPRRGSEPRPPLEVPGPFEDLLGGLCPGPGRGEQRAGRPVTRGPSSPPRTGSCEVTGPALGMCSRAPCPEKAGAGGPDSASGPHTCHQGEGRSDCPPPCGPTWETAPVTAPPGVRGQVAKGPQPEDPGSRGQRPASRPGARCLWGALGGAGAKGQCGVPTPGRASAPVHPSPCGCDGLWGTAGTTALFRGGLGREGDGLLPES